MVDLHFERRGFEPLIAHFRVTLRHADAPPVFFGHYRLSPVDPFPLAVNVACLDNSLAKPTG